MSVYWYLVDAETRESFELNKGNWDAIGGDWRTPVPERSVDDLAPLCLEAICRWPTDDRGPAAVAYAREVAEKIHAFCCARDWRPRLVNDAGWTREGWDYREVGSRFRQAISSTEGT